MNTSPINFHFLTRVSLFFVMDEESGKATLTLFNSKSFKRNDASTARFPKIAPLRPLPKKSSKLCFGIGSDWMNLQKAIRHHYPLYRLKIDGNFPYCLPLQSFYDGFFIVKLQI